jgi:hypothetical protein
MAVEKDDKVELQYIPAYVKHAEMNKKMALERRRIREEALMGKSVAERNSQRPDVATPKSLPRRQAEPSERETNLVEFSGLLVFNDHSVSDLRYCRRRRQLLQCLFH